MNVNVEEMLVGCENYEDMKLTLDLKRSILKSLWRLSRGNPVHKMAVLGKMLFECNFPPTFGSKNESIPWK